MYQNSERVVIGVTESVCPQCLRRITAEKVKYGTKIYMEKKCPEHGDFKVLIWNGAPLYENWSSPKVPSKPVNCLTQADKGCPYDCGLCPEHRQQSCCVLLEVTERCGLKCPICFASSGENALPDPTMEEISGWFDLLMKCGGPFNIQLSGGEPTERDDLEKIIQLGKKKGFSFFQLNTNGLRLANEDGYAEKLRKAGLDCVFLQFDGLSDEVYMSVRGRKLLKQKELAIEKSAQAGLGVVLVPTLISGVNDKEIGLILNFSFKKMPAVRGVHFQPISYFGRYEKFSRERITIPDILRSIEEQTEGRMKAEYFSPGSAENAYCSFNGNFVLMADGEIRPWRVKGSDSCQPTRSAAEKAKKAQAFVAKQWGGRAELVSKKEENEGKRDSLDEFLYRIKNFSLAVSGMAFQDAWNLDLNRLRECYIHVVSKDNRIIPFCAYNLTAENGKALYRGRDT